MGRGLRKGTIGEGGLTRRVTMEYLKSDVVVLEAGGAGLAAAITVAEGGDKL